MTITIDLPSEAEAALRERAKKEGVGLGDFLRDVLIEKAEPTLMELLRPLHIQTERLGMSEKELEELIDGEVEEYRKITPLRCR